MGAGLPKFATINLGVLGMHYHAGEEVTLESLRQKRLLNVSGREAKLPLKVSSASRAARVFFGRVLGAVLENSETRLVVCIWCASFVCQGFGGVGFGKEHFLSSQIVRLEARVSWLPWPDRLIPTFRAALAMAFTLSGTTIF